MKNVATVSRASSYPVAGGAGGTWRTASLGLATRYGRRANPGRSLRPPGELKRSNTTRTIATRKETEKIAAASEPPVSQRVRYA